MKVFKNKRIGVFFIALMLTVSIVGLNSRKETVDTMSWSVSNKVIVLDAGHGLPDEGAVSDLRNYRSKD